MTRIGKPIRHRNGWRVRWTDERGRRLSRTFDDSQYEAALEFLQREKRRVDRVKRGWEAPQPEKKTFADLCDVWIEVRVSRLRRPGDALSIIETHLRPCFGGMDLSAIRTSVVDTYSSDKLEGRGLSRPLSAKTVHNHLTLFKSMLTWAVDEGWVTRVPTIRKPKIDRSGQNAVWLRSKTEIESFLASAREEGEQVHLLYWFALETGLRLGEVAGLRWESVDLKSGRITVSRSFSGPTKSGRTRTVFVDGELLQALREWALKTDSRTLFFSRRGTPYSNGTFRIFQETFQRVLLRSGLPSKATHQRGEYLTFHGLRHTFACHWLAEHGNICRLKTILGHSSVTVTERYVHLAETLAGGEPIDGSAAEV